MKNYDAFESYRVLGSNMQNIVEAFGNFSLIASKILAEEGLGAIDENGLAKFQPDEWYPLKGNLKALFRIGDEYGDYVLRQAGSAVLKNATFPPNVTDLQSGLASLDIAYHMNHAHGRKPMFSAALGKIEEGIGNYGCKPIAGKKEVHMVCSNPYPCAFDQSLILALAKRFQPTASLVHQEPAKCRSKSGTSCTYVVTWR